MKGIYAIVNDLHGGKYIGSSNDIGHRFLTHLNQLRNFEHPNRHLLLDYYLFGAEFFHLELLLEIETTKHDLLLIENKFIESGRNLYNVTTDTIHNKYTQRWQKRQRYT